MISASIGAVPNIFQLPTIILRAAAMAVSCHYTDAAVAEPPPREKHRNVSAARSAIQKLARA
ncbi:MAG TPA: hypothetical protein PK808_05140, partial [Polymorphobacter sp.]|nr:hypothetical protein [Polymorphobacter sp.]